ncbi:MAG: Gfo/Idh/MocA family oxidoreductase [Actinomycetota bacterium]
MVSTSWWADAMYLPALTNHPDADVVAVAGRNPERAAAFADRWSIPAHYTDTDSFFDHDLDAVVIASANDSHHPLTLQALRRGLHVLCEKPLGLTTAEAREMEAAATDAGVATLVPFTYRYMPMFRWVKELVDTGHVGTPHHLNMRYFTGYARNGEYLWRFDRGEAGSGVIGDLGSHWVAIAMWLLGEPVAVNTVSTAFVPRGPRPDGVAYEPGEDWAVMTVRFESGAHAVLQVSAVCPEPGDFGQTHALDVHGTDGSLYAMSDWVSTQEVRGSKAADTAPASVLPIPEHIWGGAPRDVVGDTYRHVFRSGGHMIGNFIDAARDGSRCEPDFSFGRRVQEVCDAAVASAASGGGMVSV